MAVNTETRLTQLETRSEEYVKKSDISATLARLEGKIGELSTALNYQKWILGLLVLGQLFMLGRLFEIIYGASRAPPATRSRTVISWSWMFIKAAQDCLPFHNKASLPLLTICDFGREGTILG